jgi:hypothetical protein
VLPSATETLSTMHVAAAYLMVVAVFGVDCVTPLGAGIRSRESRVGIHCFARIKARAPCQYATEPANEN